MSLIVDWYCCNAGPFHVRQAMNPSLPLVEDDALKRWVMNEDRVLARAAAIAVGLENIDALVAHFKERKEGS